jgi:signal transduction histidine kinase
VSSAALSESSSRPQVVAVLTPTGRDGQLAERVLGRWGMQVTAFPDAQRLSAAIRGGVGAVILAEECLVPGGREEIMSALDEQPGWSDVPVIILTADGELSRAIAAGVEALASRGNATLLERPVRMATLVTVTRAALRARQRQYELRDQLERLGVARAEAESANRAKMEFLAMMSHELRTPLNAIGGYAALFDLGIRGPISLEQRQDLQRIQKSQRHLLGLINGVLNFARIETGQVSNQLDDVAMIELLDTAESLIAPQARDRAIRLDVERCAPEIVLRADAEKVQQVMLNLLTNAVKFTEPGGCVRVHCTSRGEMATVVVEDTGRGIPSEKLEAIFEPFIQVETQLTRTHDGVGLGLAISRDLARGMGGDLTVRSTVGEGSTFMLMLPMASVPEPVGTNSLSGATD